MTADGFATFAATRDEAIRQFRAHEARCCHVSGCDNDASALLDGIGLCMVHYGNVVRRSGAADNDRTPPGEVRHTEEVRSETRTERPR